MNPVIKIGGNALGIALIATAFLLDPNFALIAANTDVIKVSESQHRAAEVLMLEAQARAYANGRICECKSDNFIDQVVGVEPERYHADDLLTAQAAAYSRGEIHWSVSPNYVIADTDMASSEIR